MTKSRRRWWRKCIFFFVTIKNVLIGICCKKTLISITNFEVGHVIAEKDDGTLEISNLRPICSVCNHSMGTENMVDFVKKYGYFIG